MNARTRLGAAVSGTLGLFLAIQLGALAMVDPFIAAEAQPVEDPTDPSNSLLFFGVMLVATAVMLAAIKLGREQLIRAFVVFAAGFVAWLVFDVLARPLYAVQTGSNTLDLVLAWTAFLLPFAVGLAIVAGLLVHPEWYVIDGAGVVLGAGAAGLFGITFSPFPAIVFLSILAVYDAISVYGTEHMLELADGVIDLNVPVLLVIPTTLSYTMLGDRDPEALSGEADDDVDGESDATGDPSTEPKTQASRANDGSDPESVETGDRSAAVDDGSGALDEDDTDLASEPASSDDADRPDDVREALYIGLGDAVMPTILVASAAYFLRDEVPTIDVPGIALNLPALTAMIGTSAGLLVLLWLVLKGRAHAGLPLLNGGTILGYLVGALVSGLTLAEAVGFPF